MIEDYENDNMTDRQRKLLELLLENEDRYLLSTEIYDFLDSSCILDDEKYQCRRSQAYKLINEDVEAINALGKMIVISSRSEGYKIAATSEEFEGWFEKRDVSLRHSIKTLYRLKRHAAEHGQYQIPLTPEDLKIISVFDHEEEGATA